MGKRKHVVYIPDLNIKRMKADCNDVPDDLFKGSIFRKVRQKAPDLTAPPVHFYGEEPASHVVPTPQITREMMQESLEGIRYNRLRNKTVNVCFKKVGSHQLDFSELRR